MEVNDFTKKIHFWKLLLIFFFLGGFIHNFESSHQAREQLNFWRILESRGPKFSQYLRNFYTPSQLNLRSFWVFSTVRFKSWPEITPERKVYSCLESDVKIVLSKWLTLSAALWIKSKLVFKMVFTQNASLQPAKWNIWKVTNSLEKSVWRKRGELPLKIAAHKEWEIGGI